MKSASKKTHKPRREMWTLQSECESKWRRKERIKENEGGGKRWEIGRKNYYFTPDIGIYIGLILSTFLLSFSFFQIFLFDNPENKNVLSYLLSLSLEKVLVRGCHFKIHIKNLRKYKFLVYIPFFYSCQRYNWYIFIISFIL